MKEIKDDPNTKTYHALGLEVSVLAKMTLIPSTVCFSALPSVLQMAFFKALEEKTYKVVWNHKRP